MNSDMSNDEQALVAAYLAGRDEDAFRRLYRHCSPRLYLLALRLSGGRAHDADDVLQEAWIRACAALPRFRWESRLHTWLGGIVVNCWRESRRRPPSDDEGLEEVAVPPHDFSDLESLITALPERCRAVVVMHDIEGYTHEEIAAALVIAAGTSKHQLHRGRTLLRAWLQEKPHAAR
jgi:RNA polymerase sigma factor (sigma-70 family)